MKMAITAAKNNFRTNLLFDKFFFVKLENADVNSFTECLELSSQINKPFL